MWFGTAARFACAVETTHDADRPCPRNVGAFAGGLRPTAAISHASRVLSGTATCAARLRVCLAEVLTQSLLGLTADLAQSAALAIPKPRQRSMATDRAVTCALRA